MDYLDLYLVHWPFSFEEDSEGNVKADKDGKSVIKSVPKTEPWAAMEELLEKGKVKSIGVSNFDIPHLKELLGYCKVKPAVNQCELHPFLPQDRLHKFCKEHGIHLEAYSPLGSGEDPSPLNDPHVKEVAKTNNLTPAQVLISWSITRGVIAIPKTSKPERLNENFGAKKLDDESMQKINSIKERHRLIKPTNFFKHDCFENSE